MLIESKGERAFFIADLVPTAAHLPLPWIMGYDVEPLVTLETKRRILAAGGRGGLAGDVRARRDDAWGRMQHDGKAYALAPWSLAARRG